MENNEMLEISHFNEDPDQRAYMKYAGKAEADERETLNRWHSMVTMCQSKKLPKTREQRRAELEAILERTVEL